MSDLFEDLGKNEPAAVDNSALEDFLSAPTNSPEADVDAAFEAAQAAMEEEPAEVEAAAEEEAPADGDKPKSEKTPEDLLSEFEKMLG